MIENVPGLMFLDGGKEMGAILEFVRSIGYKVAEPQVLQAADFGVPQYRQRLLIVGARGRQVPIMPLPTHGSGTLFQSTIVWHVTVAEALAGLPSRAMNHIPRRHNGASVARYRQLGIGKREKVWRRRDRLDPRRPSKTVIAGGVNGGGRSHLHPFLARTLTAGSVRGCRHFRTTLRSWAI